MIDKDEFDAWRDNEVTQAVFRLLERKQDEAKQKWLAVFDGSDDVDPQKLLGFRIALRAKADVMGEIMDLAFEDIEESNEQE